ncbi:putative outer membrane efflux protein [Candidatus Termititenax persephonae]|uniref:Outer membrane efflux protein n=1 Tax=Candidatus Termititenax persephonae TaxID=2218525 RepID=A0A388TGA4_9BACT|nr:putative outer membrane efflux protein [Candidatus Termititenax persephonae]
MPKSVFFTFLSLLVFVSAAELSLRECIDTALSNNETVRIQELKVEEARAKVWAKTAALLPQLGLNAGYTRLRTETDDYNASLVLNQPLLAGGQYWSDRELAALELQQAELGLEKIKQELSLDTATAYYQLWHAQEILLANLQSLNNLRAYYNKSQQLAEQTRLPRPEELLQIEIQLGNVEIAADNAELSWWRSRNLLDDLLTRLPATPVYPDAEPHDFIFAAEPTLNVLPPRNVLERLENNYVHRLDKLAVRQREIAVISAASAYHPQINLQAYSGVEWGETFPKDETTYSQWGISLQMLLFDFLKTPKQVEQNIKVHEQALLNSKLLSRNELIKYSDVAAALRKAEQKISWTVLNMHKAEKSLSLYQERGQSYTANSKQLLDAEQTALQARISQLDSILDYNLHAIELKRLLGESL